MPYPGAVKVHLDPDRVRVFRDSDDFLLRDYRPVERVLESNDLSRCAGTVRERMRLAWKRAAYK